MVGGVGLGLVGWLRVGSGLVQGWFAVVSGGCGVWVDLGLGLGLRSAGVLGEWDRSCRAQTVLDSIPSIASIIPKMRMMRGGGGVRGPGTGTYIHL